MTTNSDYFAIDAISATIIKAGAKSMLHMRYAATHTREATPAMRWGSLVHLAILEPERAATGLHVVDCSSKRVKAWTEAVAEYGSDNVVTAAEMGELDEIVSALYRNKLAAELIESTQHEVPLEWYHDAYGNAKSKLDGLDASVGIVEVKTTASIVPRDFQRTMLQMGYPLQLGWYRHGVEMTTGQRLPVHAITVEQKPPHDVVVYPVSDALLDAGQEQAIDIATRYRQCCESGVWPGLQTGTEVLELPDWANSVPEIDLSGIEEM